MKLSNHSELEEDAIGDFKAIVSSVRQEDLGLALSMVSKNLYSNPIGSFIRELVSNAVDANRDNNITSLVKVDIFKENDQWFFRVTDQGKGMTPEIIETVYMSWFNSDKRNDNNKIGGWGIGSKSPLGYVGQFEITTIAEGIKYEYLFVDKQPLPEAIPLSSNPTKEKSGTSITLEVKESDLFTIHKECEKQLAYFDNVVVQHDKYFYENNFNIYNVASKGFKFRTGVYPFGNQMHITVGKVPYPINWSLLGIDVIYCPIALTFEIGELPVTLSREEINYGVEVKEGELSPAEIIQCKIEEVLAFIEEIYSKQFTTKSIIELNEFWKQDRDYISIEGYKIPFITNKRPSPKLVIGNQSFKINKDSIDELLYMFQVQILSKTKVSERPMNLTFNNINSFYREKEINHWANLYHEEGYIISKKSDKGFLRSAVHIANLLKLRETRSINNFISSSPVLEYRRVPQLGYHKILYKIYKALKNHFKSSNISYDIVPESFIQEEKEKQARLKEERKGNITYYTPSGKQASVQLEDLLIENKHIFYLSKDEDQDVISAYFSLFNRLPNFLKRVRFLVVSKTTCTRLKRFDICKPAEFIFRFAPLFPHFMNYKYRDELIKAYLNISLAQIKNVSTYYGNIFKNVKEQLGYHCLDTRFSTDPVDVYQVLKPEFEKVFRYAENNGKKYRKLKLEQELQELILVSPLIMKLIYVNDLTVSNQTIRLLQNKIVNSYTYTVNINGKKRKRKVTKLNNRLYKKESN